MTPLLDLRREARKDPLSIPGLDEIPAEERAAALDNWRSRMVSEHASARVFAALIPKLMAAGIARRHVAAVSAMIGQELDHAVLCARVVVALGGEAKMPLPELAAIPAHEDATPLEGLLRDVISVSCCSETVAVALVATEREQAGTPSLRGVLGKILADEVKHARFGWRLLDEVGPTLDARTRRRLSAYLVVAFEHQIAFHSPFLRLPTARSRAVSLGAPDGPSNWRVFLDTLAQVTIPGLARHGLESERAWNQATAAAIAA
ncbi:MAG: ferritin-like domain-containing protein [Byssovorax sp.]